jgi:N-acetylmuramoyl-L-alanine amidase
VIDPGHGGKDPGAVGKRSYEKNLNLTLAKKVGEKISSQYADVKVVYTRSDDTFVPLQQRADIANSNHADLFLSIHTNSSESKEPKGLETFILGTDKMEKNLDVAMRENAVMMLESDYKTRYQGFDPNSIDSYIMFELMQNSYLDQSLQFATLVQQECVKRLQRYDRGVRQAAFWVLLKTACPSILFEMGFVSSPEEERVLLQDDEMDKMAQAIADAFGAYTRKHKQVAKEVQKKAMQKESVQNGKQVRKDVPPKTTYYAVQIFASQKPLELTAPQFKGQKCKYIRVSGWYKYYTAEDIDRAKVEEKMQKLKVLFPDCWIITFQK